MTETIIEKRKKQKQLDFETVDPFKFGDLTQFYAKQNVINYLRSARATINEALDSLTIENQYQPEMDTKMTRIFENTFSKPVYDNDIDVEEFFEIITKEISTELKIIIERIADMNERFDEKWHEIEEIKKGIFDDFV